MWRNDRLTLFRWISMYVLLQGLLCPQRNPLSNKGGRPVMLGPITTPPCAIKLGGCLPRVATSPAVLTQPLSLHHITSPTPSSTQNNMQPPPSASPATTDPHSPSDDALAAFQEEGTALLSTFTTHQATAAAGLDWGDPAREAACKVLRRALWDAAGRWGVVRGKVPGHSPTLMVLFFLKGTDG